MPKQCKSHLDCQTYLDSRRDCFKSSFVIFIRQQCIKSFRLFFCKTMLLFSTELDLTACFYIVIYICLHWKTAIAKERSTILVVNCKVYLSISKLKLPVRIAALAEFVSLSQISQSCTVLKIEEKNVTKRNLVALHNVFNVASLGYYFIIAESMLYHLKRIQMLVF